MTTNIFNASVVIQGGNATTRPPATSQTQNSPSAEELQKAAQELRDAFGPSFRREITAARARAAQDAQAAANAQVAAPAAPPPPTGNRTFTIRGADGSETVIGVPPRPFNDVIPPQAVDISIAFFLTVAAIIIGLPLARAFARRMDRRGGPTQIPNEIASQLSHLNQAVDAIALEVERISEGQRFATRLLSEQRDAKDTLPSAAQR